MTDWKNNPVVIALITGSTVLTTTLFIVFTYIIPVYQKEDSNKISELNKEIQNKQLLINEITNNNKSFSSKKDSEIETLSAFKNKEIDDLKIENKATQKELDSLKKFINKLKLNSFYQKGAYLPIGFESVGIGDSRDSIFKVYGSPRVVTSPKYGYVKVKYDAGIIDDVVYYFSDDDKNKVSHIAVNMLTFSLDENESEVLKNSSFKDLLLNTLGYTEPCKGDYYTWNIPNKNLVVYYDDSSQDSYIIMDNQSYPPLFDKECALNNFIQLNNKNKKPSGILSKK
ncbi:hypothetical protein ACXDLH_001691 [Klebsiella pneumoniae]